MRDRLRRLYFRSERLRCLFGIWGRLECARGLERRYGATLEQHQWQPHRKDHRSDDHAHETHRAEGLLLNVGDAQQEADAVVHAQEEAGHNPFLQLYALVLGESGMRCESEALWIQWGDIDLEGGFIKIVSGRGEHRTKSGHGRWVPLTDRLRQALRDHSASYRPRTYAGNRSPWVFHHDCRRRRAAAGGRIGSLRRAFHNAVTRAELPAGFTQHDLRHRRITTWLGEGKSAVLVKEAVGHSDLRTTMAYTHLSREHLKALVSGSEDRPQESGELQTLVS